MGDFRELIPSYSNEELESRLWENDSSYLVAVSPKLFENNRIKMKVILGYRMQSLVHGLPSLEDELSQQQGNAYGSQFPMNARSRRALYRRNLLSNITPEKFNQLPEHQQRAILRDRYLQKQFNQNNDLLGQAHQSFPGSNHRHQFENFSFQNLSYWAMRNMDQLGWKSFAGMFAFVFALYKTITTVFYPNR